MVAIVRRALTALALLGLLAAPALEAQAQAAGKRVALFQGPQQDQYLGAWGKSFTEAATKAGLKVTLFASPFDPALQAQQLDDAIAQKFDLFVVQILSQKAIIPPLTRVKAAKIPVILNIVPMFGNEGQDLYVSFVGFEQSGMGKMAGEVLMNAINRKGAKVAVVSGSLNEGLAPVRAAAFKEAVTKAGGEVVAIEDAMWNPANGERITGQLLARYAAQGGLDGIYGMNDVLANSVVQAAESAGVKLGTAKGSLAVVGGNCLTPGVKNIESGKMVGSLVAVPTEEGRATAARAVDLLSGKTLPKQVYLPIEPLTQANLAKHKATCTF